MPRDSTTTWLPALAGRVRDLDAVFSCGGVVELAAPVGLRFRDGSTLRIERDHGWRSTDVGKRLIRRCEPAPFGQGRQTRHDRRVRHGWQLSARNRAFQVLGLDLGATGILEEVRRALCPEHTSVPDAELHAVNVYTDGGYFVSHKDMPAALLVTIPPARERGRARTRVPLDFEDEREPSVVPSKRELRPLGEPSSDVLANFVGSMTVAELCRRCGISVESLAKFCLAGKDTLEEPEHGWT